MPIFRRSIRQHCCKHKATKREVDYLGGQIYKFKVRKLAVDQITNNEILECKVDKNMLDQPTHVQMIELKPDLASSYLHNNEFAAHDSGMDIGPFQPEPQHNLAQSNQHAPALHTYKRKRGRPRKNVDGRVAVPLAIMPAPHPNSDVPPSLLPPPIRNAKKLVMVRRARAASSTATNKQRINVTAPGSGMIEMNPEVIAVQAGQEVGTKIMSLSGNGWAVCVLSAHGVVSSVTLHQGASSGENVIYEGYFEMLSLCGSYEPSETDGMSIRTGGLSVSLSSVNGRVFGGRVSGPLIAASPIQVVIGRFPVGEKNKLKWAATGGIPGSSSSTLQA